MKPTLDRECQQSQQEAARLRRAVLRVLPERGSAGAAAVLDVGAHTVHAFFGDELAELPSLLVSFDVVAALWVRESLHAVFPARLRLAAQPMLRSQRQHRWRASGFWRYDDLALHGG